MRDAAALCSADDVIALATQGTAVNNWWFHTEIRCGAVLFTASPVNDPSDLVRPAEFRQQYALHNRQYRLFDDDQPIGIDEAVPLYGVILHGRGFEKQGELGFAVVRFPTADLSGYFEVAIDLFAEFPDVVSEMQPKDGKADDDGLDIEFREGDQTG